MKGIYIHIPFCKNKCNYCHFVSKTDTSLMEPYVYALIKEIEMYKDKYDDIYSIYIGGGTPSLLDIRSLKLIVNALDIKNHCEFTIEVNPESVTLEKLNVYRELGINRISMGVQTSSNQMLSYLGRIHTFEDVVNKIKMIRQVGFDNLNIDLIYALPNQTIEELNMDIDKFLELEPEHISTYSLTYDEGTLFHKLLLEKKIKAIDDDLDRKMFHLIEKELGDNNYKRYEISNFSKKGYESKHNLLYWNADEYIGLGVSAHGYLDSNRYENSSDIEEYIEMANKNTRPIINVVFIDHNEAIFEYIILNLRKTIGFSIKEINEKFDLDFLGEYKDEMNYLIKNKTIEVSSGRVFLTNYGFDISNSVFVKFLK